MVFVLVVAAVVIRPKADATYDPTLFQEMRWRHIGPFRGGRTVGAAGVAQQPNVFYIGVNNGGVWKTTDYGLTWTPIFDDQPTQSIGAVAVAPSDPNVVYVGSGEGLQRPDLAVGDGIYRSGDAGKTWTHYGLRDGQQIPTIAVDPRDPNRLFVAVLGHPYGANAERGIFPSTDAGESWTLVNNKAEIWERGGDFNEVRADPKNPDVLYVANVVTWKSVDGGKTWQSFRGAPGGDDYHRVWVNPIDTKIILIASDQGAIVTLNGGESWSSWYNQPTAQMFHVNADNAFPYRVCGGQQESGSACVQTRGDDGRVTFREWHPAAVEEYGYAVPDPLDPDTVYGGKLS